VERREAGTGTGHDLRPKGDSRQPLERKTYTMLTDALNRVTLPGAPRWCSSTAVVSACSSAIAFGTHSVLTAILLAALSCVSVAAVCITAVIEAWNRDPATIDARTRAKSLRSWARKASTPEERERAARLALAPMILSGDSASGGESMKDLLPP
jgi:hypothetical protein